MLRLANFPRVAAAAGSIFFILGHLGSNSSAGLLSSDRGLQQSDQVKASPQRLDPRVRQVAIDIRVPLMHACPWQIFASMEIRSFIMNPSRIPPMIRYGALLGEAELRYNKSK